MAIYPVILAGGSGARLWPLSRQNHPKQYLDVLDSGETLIQSTLARVRLCSSETPLIIAQAEHRFLLQHQLDHDFHESTNVLLEPSSRNTLGAVAIACLEVLKINPDASVLVVPADHFVADTQAFLSAVNHLSAALESDEIGLLGVTPSYAATQYGYIEYKLGSAAHPVQSFIEKPDEVTAQSLIEKSNIVWNGGIVLAKAQAVYDALKQYCPSSLALIEQAYAQSFDQYGFTFIGAEYNKIESLSFDVGVLEKHGKLKVVPLDCEWDDLGSWPSLIKRRQKLNHPSSSVFSSGKTVLAFTDHEMVLVEDDDVVMMADKDKLADMSKISDFLIAHKLTDLLNRIDIHRPWGQFKVLAQSPNYVVKHLQVFPGCQISLQSHDHRQEHWVVVKGEARIQLDEQELVLVEGQAVSVARKQKHRLKNEQASVLEIIEVQSGSVLDENDIVRYDDEYNRHIKVKH